MSKRKVKSPPAETDTREDSADECLPSNSNASRSNLLLASLPARLQAREFKFQDYSRLLECSNCLDTPYPPVFVCRAGHTICNVCSEKVQQCGICKKRVTQTRNIFYELCFGKAKFDCKYSAEGCKEVLSGHGLEGHYSICDYRSILCHTDESCGKIPYKSYVTHFQEMHAGKTCIVNQPSGAMSFLYPLDSETTGPKLTENWEMRMLYGPHTFLLRSTAGDTSTAMYLSVIGNSAVAEQFCVHIRLQFKISSANTALRKNIDLTWQGPVQTVHKMPNELLSSGCAFSINNITFNAINNKINPENKSTCFCVCQIWYKNSSKNTGIPAAVLQPTTTIPAPASTTSASATNAASLPSSVAPLTTTVTGPKLK